MTSTVVRTRIPRLNRKVSPQCPREMLRIREWVGEVTARLLSCVGSDARREDPGAVVDVVAGSPGVGAWSVTGPAGRSGGSPGSGVATGSAVSGRAFSGGRGSATSRGFLGTSSFPDGSDSSDGFDASPERALSWCALWEAAVAGSTGSPGRALAGSSAPGSGCVSMGFSASSADPSGPVAEISGSSSPRDGPDLSGEWGGDDET